MNDVIKRLLDNYSKNTKIFPKYDDPQSFNEFINKFLDVLTDDDLDKVVDGSRHSFSKVVSK